jgi:hypothetical protein
LLTDSPDLADNRGLKGAVAALGFILEKSAKNLCSPDDLEKEMLQLGMSSGSFHVRIFISMDA